MENELRRIGMVDYKFNLDSDYEKCMAVIDEMPGENIPIPTHPMIVRKSVVQEVSGPLTLSS